MDLSSGIHADKLHLAQHPGPVSAATPAALTSDCLSDSRAWGVWPQLHFQGTDLSRQGPDILPLPILASPATCLRQNDPGRSLKAQVTLLAANGRSRPQTQTPSPGPFLCAPMLLPRPLKHEAGKPLRKEDRLACGDARAAPRQLQGAQLCLLATCEVTLHSGRRLATR